MLVRKHPWVALQIELLLIVCLGGFLLYEIRNDIDAIRFGEWRTEDPNLAHEAKEDGFVVVRTFGGNDESDREFEVHVGIDKDTLESENIARVRGKMWDSATTPVPKGYWWLVKVKEGSGSIKVFWLSSSNVDTRHD